MSYFALFEAIRAIGREGGNVVQNASYNSTTNKYDPFTYSLGEGIKGGFDPAQAGIDSIARGDKWYETAAAFSGPGAFVGGLSSAKKMNAEANKWHYSTAPINPYMAGLSHEKLNNRITKYKSNQQIFPKGQDTANIMDTVVGLGSTIDSFKSSSKTPSTDNVTKTESNLNTATSILNTGTSILNAYNSTKNNVGINTSIDSSVAPTAPKVNNPTTAPITSGSSPEEINKATLKNSNLESSSLFESSLMRMNNIPTTLPILSNVTVGSPYTSPYLKQQNNFTKPIYNY